MNPVRRLAFFTVFLLSPMVALAVPVDFFLNGTVTEADAGNVFGLSVNDTISVFGTFDTDTIVDVTGSPNNERDIPLSSGSGNTLTLLVGIFALDETDDVLFGPGTALPSIRLDENGDFVSFNYRFNPLSGVPGLGDVFFQGFGGASLPDMSFVGGSGNSVSDLDVEPGFNGLWDSFSVSTEVPEPGTLALFGIGLAGLGLARKRKT